MLFELMALKRPFMGDNMFAVMHAIINNKVGWLFLLLLVGRYIRSILFAQSHWAYSSPHYPDPMRVNRLTIKRTDHRTT